MDLLRLKAVVGSGLLAFPVTHFRDDGSFDEGPYRASIAANIDNGAVALFAPGGTGEFFSLTLDEIRRVAAAAVGAAAGRVPIIVGTGYGTAMAIEFAKAAEQAGADAVLVLPQYLLLAEQEGIYRHIEALCRAIRIGVIVYNRDNCLFAADTLARLAESCPNLIGFKDGHGDIEQLVRIRQTLGERLVYVGGMPTAEIFAVPYFAAGFTTYSSAVYNFIPKTAQRFYRAVRDGDTRTTDELLRKFFLPYIALRSRRRGYAVSIVKAGLRIVGRPAGPVRPPLIDLTDGETAELRRILVDALGDAIH
ncbi:MAG: 5-dehydro-4-deoxyglucarate dehydratase [Proteobacteria bacterium]|nr:5-dehydro-4-deoxyglucarate dehydratase [Pseudomonadota bacterium]